MHFAPNLQYSVGTIAQALLTKSRKVLINQTFSLFHKLDKLLKQQMLTENQTQV